MFAIKKISLLDDNDGNLKERLIVILNLYNFNYLERIINQHKIIAL